MIVVGVLLNAPLYAGLAFLTQFMAVLVVAATAGLGSALIAPALSAFMLDITEPRHRSRVMGIKNSALSLGSALGPLMVVFASSVMMPRGVFLVAGGLVLLSGLLALVLLREPRTLRLTHKAGPLGQDPQRVATAQAVLHGLVMQAESTRMSR